MLLIFYRVQIQLVVGQPEMKKPKNILYASLKAYPIRAFSKKQFFEISDNVASDKIVR